MILDEARLGGVLPAVVVVIIWQLDSRAYARSSVQRILMNAYLGHLEDLLRAFNSCDRFKAVLVLSWSWDRSLWKSVEYGMKSDVPGIMFLSSTLSSVIP